MTESLTTALERSAQPREVKTIRDLVDRMKPELVKSLQDEAAVERLIRHYNTAIRLNPKLQACTAESLLGALLLSAQVGLEPGPLGHVYLVPYGSECTWILGYTGILELARRSERVGMLRARLVWDNDLYSGVREDERGEHFTFEPGDEAKRKDRRCVVVSWKERVGSAWMPRALEATKSRVERAQKASPAARKNSGPWISDPDAMWRKTGIRFARPWLPLLPEAGQAFQADEGIVRDVIQDESGAAQADVIAVEA